MGRRAGGRGPVGGVPVGRRWRNGGDPRAAATRKMRVVPVAAAKMAAPHVAGAKVATGPAKEGDGGATIAIPAQRQRARCALSQCCATLKPLPPASEASVPLTHGLLGCPATEQPIAH